MPSKEVDRDGPVRRIVSEATSSGLPATLSTLRHGLAWRWRRLLDENPAWLLSLRTAVARIEFRLARASWALPPCAATWLQNRKWPRRLIDRLSVSALAPGHFVAVSRIRVSVIVTSRNHSETLPIVLRSVQMQDFSDLECLVVDDGSTDDSVLVAQRFSEVDHRFRVLLHDRQLGQSATVNTGIAAADGHYLCILDGGAELLLKDSIRERLQCLRGEQMGHDGSICEWTWVAPDSGMEVFTRAGSATRGYVPCEHTRLASGHARVSAAAMIRRDAIVKLRGFDETGDGAGSHDDTTRLEAVHLRLIATDHIGVARRSPPSTSLSQVSVELPSTSLSAAALAGGARQSDLDAGSSAGVGRGRCRVITRVPRTLAPDALVDGAVILLAEARYHVAELGPLSEQLRARDIPVCFMVSPATVPSAVVEIGAYADHMIEFSPIAARRAGAVVVLNDWGPVRELVQLANEAGVPTFAKVEGVQDFEDVDTGRVREPYRSARTVLAQGINDFNSLRAQRVEVVGSSRLERIWNDPPVTRGDHALINLNFTFRVMTEHRETWLRSVGEALDSIGVAGVVSCHPAEAAGVSGLIRSIGSMNAAKKPFSYEITRAGVLISRFSTVPFEAIARGVPFVYHNPHEERVAAFAEPNGAFHIATNSVQLAHALTAALGPDGDDYRSTARDFFLRQVDMVEGYSSEERAAIVIEAALVG